MAVTFLVDLPLMHVIVDLAVTVGEGVGVVLGVTVGVGAGAS